MLSFRIGSDVIREWTLRCACFGISLCLASTVLWGQQPTLVNPASTDPVARSGAPKPGNAVMEDTSNYELGPGDEVKVWVLGLEEELSAPARVDPAGNLDFPIAGRIHAVGMTVEELTKTLVERLSKELIDPMVSVQIVDYGSQPVSVLGAVNTPGVHQLRGRKTLLEALSLAGGPRADAGSAIMIARRKDAGTIPLPNAKPDATGDYYVAEVKLKDVMTASNPSENILIRPQDVVTVTSADVVYVMGAVRKPGMFTLGERKGISSLQALSMAEGFGEAASPGDARIIREVPGATERQEIPIDLKKLLRGERTDVSLQANDILFVPTSGAKKVATRAIEAMVQTATGVVIWRR